MTDRAASTEDLRAARWLRWAVAFVWLATGVLWVHPEYRAVGGGYLARLGLPLALMPATCTLEVGLAFVVAFGPTARLVTAPPGDMLAAVLAILGAAEPARWAGVEAAHARGSVGAAVRQCVDIAWATVRRRPGA